MAISALFIPVFMAGNRLIWESKFITASFVVVLYISVLAALLSTFARYRNDQRIPLDRWRRTTYITGVILLLVLSMLPLATWPIAFSGITLHLRVAFFCLFGLNATAAVLVWFGRGWSRLGLTVVAYWVFFLWAFPLGIRG